MIAREQRQPADAQRLAAVQAITQCRPASVDSQHLVLPEDKIIAEQPVVTREMATMSPLR